MSHPVDGQPGKLEDEQPIAHHYVFVIVVEIITLTTLWWLSRYFR